MRVYLDTCCYNRPFDDLTQDRVLIEAEAVARVLVRAQLGTLALVASDVLLFELRRSPVPDRRRFLLEMAGLATEHVRTTLKVRTLANKVSALGFGDLDAAHLASAAVADVDAFLTVDDRLLRKRARLKNFPLPAAWNPVQWILEPPGTGGQP